MIFPTRIFTNLFVVSLGLATTLSGCWSMPTDEPGKSATNDGQWQPVASSNVAAISQLALIPSAQPLQPVPPDPPGVLTLAKVIETIRAQSPSLKAALQMSHAREAAVTAAGAWEDPTLGLEYQRSTSPQSGMYNAVQFSVSQQIPFSGIDKVRADIARADATVSATEAQARERDLILRARQEYYQLSYALQELDLNAATRVLLEQAVTIAQARYVSGSQGQSDLLMAETNLSTLDSARASFERQCHESEAKLRALMNLDSKTPLGRPEPLAFAAFDSDGDALRAHVFHQPEYIAAMQRVEAANQRIQEAIKGRNSDPSVYAKGRTFNGGSQVIQEVDVGVSFNLPWDSSKYNSKFETAELERDSLQSEKTALGVEMVGEVDVLLERLKTAQSQYALYNDKILPLARQSEAATRTAYENHRANFTDWLTAQRALIDAQATQLSYLFEYVESMAVLEHHTVDAPNSVALR